MNLMKKFKSIKSSRESFSDIVLNLVKKSKKRPLTDFFGKWPCPETEIENIKKIIEKGRKNSN